LSHAASSSAVDGTRSFSIIRSRPRARLEGLARISLTKSQTRAHTISARMVRLMEQAFSSPPL
jgi:hypothetical protein